MVTCLRPIRRYTTSSRGNRRSDGEVREEVFRFAAEEGCSGIVIWERDESYAMME